MEDYGTLDGMKVGLVATGELGPFSSTKLEIIWQPHIPGRVDTEFLITFSDPLSDSVSVEKALLFWYLIFCVFFKIIFFSVVLSTILSLLTQISIQAIANAIDVPVWVERQTVDLKICMYDRLYQDTIIVNNRWVDNNLTPWLLEKQMNLLFSKPKILYLSIFFIEQPLPWGWSLKYAKSWRTIWNCCQKQATFRLSPTSQHKWSFCQGNDS